MYRDHTKVIQIGNKKIGGGNPILILCISPATMVLRVALSAAFSAEFMPERLAGMIVADGGMLALGVMFLVLSLVCRYGAEREAMKQE